MTVKELKKERMRLLKLMLFYKNDEKDYEFYSKMIGTINDELKHKRIYNIDEYSQLEFLITKTINENTPENRERLKNQLMLMFEEKSKI